MCQRQKNKGEGKGGERGEQWQGKEELNHKAMDYKIISHGLTLAHTRSLSLPSLPRSDYTVHTVRSIYIRDVALLLLPCCWLSSQRVGRSVGRRLSPRALIRTHMHEQTAEPLWPYLSLPHITVFLSLDWTCYTAFLSLSLFFFSVLSLSISLSSRHHVQAAAIRLTKRSHSRGKQ